MTFAKSVTDSSLKKLFLRFFLINETFSLVLAALLSFYADLSTK